MYIYSVLFTSYIKKILPFFNQTKIKFNTYNKKTFNQILFKFFRETSVIYDENLDCVARKFEVARTVARKIVHQHFGNLVSPSWWSYMWFNEGIAMFLAMDIVNKVVS